MRHQQAEAGPGIRVGVHAHLDQAAPLRLACRGDVQVDAAIHQGSEDLLSGLFVVRDLQGIHLPHDDAHRPNVAALRDLREMERDI